MKFRIAVGAGLGFLVAVGWAVYSFSANPSPITPAEPILWNLALLTQPIALASVVSASALVSIGSFLRTLLRMD